MKPSEKKAQEASAEQQIDKRTSRLSILWYAAAIGVVAPFAAGLLALNAGDVFEDNQPPKMSIIDITHDQEAKELKVYTPEGFSCSVAAVGNDNVIEAASPLMASCQKANRSLALNGEIFSLVIEEKPVFFPNSVRTTVSCNESGACVQRSETELLRFPLTAERKLGQADSEAAARWKTFMNDFAGKVVSQANAGVDEARKRLGSAEMQAFIKQKIKPVAVSELYAFDSDDDCSGFLESKAEQWAYNGGNNLTRPVSFSRYEDGVIMQTQRSKDNTTIEITAAPSGFVQIEQRFFHDGKKTALIHRLDPETQVVEAQLAMTSGTWGALMKALTLSTKVQSPLYSAREMSEFYRHMNEVATKLETELLYGKDIPQALPRNEEGEPAPVLREAQGTFGLKALSSLLRKGSRLG